jgi:hypothetical protein
LTAMSSFNRADYSRIFAIGRSIYGTGQTRETRELGVELMFMAESVLGQMDSWPDLSKHYRTFLTELERRTQP